MNLYVLTRINEDGSEGADFDEVAGFVIAAEDEGAARHLATYRHGDEGPWPWRDVKKTRCHLVGQALPEQSEGILMRDFHSA